MITRLRIFSQRKQQPPDLRKPPKSPEEALEQLQNGEQLLKTESDPPSSPA